MIKKNILLLSLALLMGASVKAQAIYGEITGTVTDPSGAVVPGAHVALHDVDRGVDYVTTGNSSGNFTQTHLLPGDYNVLIIATGFTDYAVDAVVQVDSITRITAAMQVGGNTQSVSVTGEAPLLKTDRADVSNTLTANQLGKLPILDRNVTSLCSSALPGGGLITSTGGSKFGKSAE